ncbi:MAG: hypothetical protein U1F77_07215 [Kiritimatiellia bacterium]
MTFSIAPGEKVRVWFWPQRLRKTTLLKLLNGLIPAESGEHLPAVAACASATCPRTSNWTAPGPSARTSRPARPTWSRP